MARMQRGSVCEIVREARRRAGAALAAFATVILSRESFPFQRVVSVTLESPPNVPGREQTPQDELTNPLVRKRNRILSPRHAAD